MKLGVSFPIVDFKTWKQKQGHLLRQKLMSPAKAAIKEKNVFWFKGLGITYIFMSAVGDMKQIAPEPILIAIRQLFKVDS